MEENTNYEIDFILRKIKDLADLKEYEQLERIKEAATSASHNCRDSCMSCNVRSYLEFIGLGKLVKVFNVLGFDVDKEISSKEKLSEIMYIYDYQDLWLYSYEDESEARRNNKVIALIKFKDSKWCWGELPEW